MQRIATLCVSVLYATRMDEGRSRSMAAYRTITLLLELVQVWACVDAGAGIEYGAVTAGGDDVDSLKRCIHADDRFCDRVP